MEYGAFPVNPSRSPLSLVETIGSGLVRLWNYALENAKEVLKAMTKIKRITVKYVVSPKVRCHKLFWVFSAGDHINHS